MTVQIGEKTLNCVGIMEDSELVGTQWDSWIDEQFKRKIFIVALKRKWRLECTENNVAWANSAVPYLQQKAATGEALTLTINIGDRYQVSTNVYVISVSLRLKPTGQTNIRHFTVQLKEV